MSRFIAVGLALLLPLAPVSAQTKRDVRAEDVKASISKGIKYLSQAQQAAGGWEIDGNDRLRITMANPGGKTALALLALLNCGLKSSDTTVAVGLKHLRSFAPDKVYVCALQILVYA